MLPLLGQTRVAEVITECWSGFPNGNGFNSLVRLRPTTQVNWQHTKLLSGYGKEKGRRTHKNPICSQSADSPEASRHEILRAAQQRGGEYVSSWVLHVYLHQLTTFTLLFTRLITFLNVLQFNDLLFMTDLTGVNHFGHFIIHTCHSPKAVKAKPWHFGKYVYSLFFLRVTQDDWYRCYVCWLELGDYLSIQAAEGN